MILPVYTQRRCHCNAFLIPVVLWHIHLRLQKPGSSFSMLPVYVNTTNQSNAVTSALPLVHGSWQAAVQRLDRET